MQKVRSMPRDGVMRMPWHHDVHEPKAHATYSMRHCVSAHWGRSVCNNIGPVHPQPSAFRCNDTQLGSRERTGWRVTRLGVQIVDAETCVAPAGRRA